MFPHFRGTQWLDSSNRHVTKGTIKESDTAEEEMLIKGFKCIIISTWGTLSL